MLIDKYKSGIIKSVTQFRDINKIVRAKDVHLEAKKPQDVLRRLFQEKEYSIESAFKESVSDFYSEKEVLDRIESLTNRLSLFEPSDIDEDLKQHFVHLRERIDYLLGGEDAL
jgi:hypothetical protein